MVSSTWDVNISNYQGRLPVGVHCRDALSPLMCNIRPIIIYSGWEDIRNLLKRYSTFCSENKFSRTQLDKNLVVWQDLQKLSATLCVLRRPPTTYNGQLAPLPRPPTSSNVRLRSVPFSWTYKRTLSVPLWWDRALTFTQITTFIGRSPRTSDERSVSVLDRGRSLDERS